LKVLLLGSTGLIGSLMLDLMQHDLRFSQIICPVRKNLHSSSKVKYVSLSEHSFADNIDAMLCALGTTKRKAGSIQAQEAIDRDLVVQWARESRKHGIQRIGVVSSIGANDRSSIPYLRIKGEMEREVATLGFPFITFAQPSLLLGKRHEQRPLEDISKKFTHPFLRFLPKTIRPIDAKHVAQALVDDLFRNQPGLRYWTNCKLVMTYRDKTP